MASRNDGCLGTECAYRAPRILHARCCACDRRGASVVRILDREFGARVRALRLSRGMLQSQFGEFLGVSKSAVSNWENGTCHPHFLTIPDIADRLGVSIEWLVAGRGEGPRLDPHAPLHRAIKQR